MRMSLISSDGLKPLKRIQDVRYGMVDLYINDITSKLYTCSKTTFGEKEKALEYFNSTKKKKKLPHINYVAPEEIDIVDKINFCSTFYTVRIFIPYPQEDLKQKKIRYFNNYKCFSNYEMMEILYDLIEGMNHLNQLGFDHGLIRPEMIVKSLKGYAIMDNPHKVEYFNLKKDFEIYLSPEGFECAIKKQTINFDLMMHDVYVVGLILLELGIGNSIRDIYENDTFHQSKVYLYLNLLRKRYPKNILLWSTIEKMLSFSPLDRPSFHKIKTTIPSKMVISKYFQLNGDFLPENSETKRKNILNSPISDKKERDKISKKKEQFIFKKETKKSIKLTLDDFIKKNIAEKVN